MKFALGLLWLACLVALAQGTEEEAQQTDGHAVEGISEAKEDLTPAEGKFGYGKRFGRHGGYGFGGYGGYGYGGYGGYGGFGGYGFGRGYYSPYYGWGNGWGGYGYGYPNYEGFYDW